MRKKNYISPEMDIELLTADLLMSSGEDPQDDVDIDGEWLEE